MKDQNVMVEKLHPAAAATANSDAIDLGSTTPGPLTEKIQVRIYSEALPSLADGKTATVTLEDSADGSSFTAVPSVATFVQTGAGGAGAAALERTIHLPPNIRRYIRASSTIQSAGGDNTAKKFGIDALFN